MNRNMLEIVMPASMLAVAGAIGYFLLLLGQSLSAPVAQVTTTAPTDSVVVTSYGVMRVTVTGAERLPDSLAARYLLPIDSARLQIDPASVAAGDALFKGNCAQCHAVHDVVVGPALSGVRKRRPEPWLRTWVRNSGKLIASGDEYAVKIYNQYQKQEMPRFQLSDKEISQILDYVQSEEGIARVSVGVVLD